MKTKRTWLFRRSFAVAIAGSLTLSICSQALANHPYFEEQTTDSGRELVERATHGDLAQAFQLANALRRSDDTTLANSLEQQRQLLATELGSLGAAGQVRLTNEFHFGACATREFLVRYPAGDMRWILKFRHSVGGYYLYDLAVTNPGS